MSDSSDMDDGEFMIFSLTDIDHDDKSLSSSNTENDADDEREDHIRKTSNCRIGLRQRRRSHNALLIPLQMKLNLNARFNADGFNENELGKANLNENANNHHHKTAELIQRRSNQLGRILPSPTLPGIAAHTSPTLPGIAAQNGNLNIAAHRLGRKRWMKAMRKIKDMKDPWEKFHIEEFEAETAIRHRYNALQKTWIQDEVIVKAEKQPFNHGAMRECYRLKKLSSTSSHPDWKRALNYVAKCYMEDVDREVYFEDVRLQMDAKLWGEEYNRHNPPKKVDIFQMSILEFKNRPQSPLYHLEHFIEGNYIKYNSNSGFVEETARLTPQAFSHFTFERSGHQVIIVDIQGVDDLWTDPQIHTAEGTDYGDGNLGTRGMALFFYSHVCNSICESLHLTPFDLAPSECIHQNKFKQFQMSATTQVRGTEELCVSASPQDRSDLTGFLLRSRTRTISSNSLSSFAESVESDEPASDLTETDDPTSPNEDEPMSPGSDSLSSSYHGHRPSRVRFRSESESEKDTVSREEEAKMFAAVINAKHRPSSIGHEINLRSLQNVSIGDSILGQIHHMMAKYHEIGRFTLVENDIDWEAALFHEKTAAELGVMEAIVTMAKIYLDLPHEVLSDYTMEDNADHTDEGVEYMLMAAHAGDRESMIYMAKAYDTGDGLGTDCTRSWIEAERWYVEAAEKTEQDDSGTYSAMMDHPVYQIKARLAEMHLEGGFGLGQDPSKSGDLYQEAADLAMEAMKGRLANKYYMLAEEAWAQVEEEEAWAQVEEEEAEE